MKMTFTVTVDNVPDTLWVPVVDDDEDTREDIAETSIRQCLQDHLAGCGVIVEVDAVK